MEPINYLNRSYPEIPNPWCSRSRAQYLGRPVEQKDIIRKVGVLYNHQLDSCRGQQLLRTSISTRTPAMIKSPNLENELIFYSKLRKPSDEEVKLYSLNSSYNMLDIKVNLNYETRSFAHFFYRPGLNFIVLQDLESNPQRKGIGSFMLYAGSLFAKERNLDHFRVVSAEKEAYTFYQKCGFKDELRFYRYSVADLESDTDTILERTSKMADGFSVSELQKAAITTCVRRWNSDISLK